MKKITLIFLLFLNLHLFGQKKLDFTINPAGFLTYLEEDFVHLDLGIEYKLSTDFGFQFNFINTYIPFNLNENTPIEVFSTDKPGTTLTIQSNFYLFPKRDFDRWYICALIGKEKFHGTFEKFTFFSSGNPAFESTIGKSIRYHAGFGLGYKRVFWNKLIVNLSANVTREFANYYSASLKQLFPDIHKKSMGTRGVRIYFGVGYRFQWDMDFFKK